MLRLRAMFGVGIRADLLSFCLTQISSSFTALDATQTGYHKRSLAEVLENLVQTGLLTRLTVGNRREYTLYKRDELQSVIGILPKIAPDWVRILELIIHLRKLVRQNQNFSALSKTALTQHALEKLKGFLQALGLSPPPFIHNKDTYYSKSFSPWLLNELQELAQGNFGRNFRIPNI
jgi:hypothetical protein